MLSVDEQKKVFLLYASKEVGYRDENRKGSREERRGRKNIFFTAESNIQSSPSRYVPIPVGVLPARGVPGGLPILCSTWWGGPSSPRWDVKRQVLPPRPFGRLHGTRTARSIQQMHKRVPALIKAKLARNLHPSRRVTAIMFIPRRTSRRKEDHPRPHA